MRNLSVKKILSPKEHSDKEKPDIVNKNENIRFIYSFQFQLIKSTLLGLLLTLLTEAVLAFLAFLIFFVAGKSSSDNFAYQPAPSSNHFTMEDPKDILKNYLESYEKEPLEKHFPSIRNLLKKQQLQKLFLLCLLVILCSLALFIFYFLLLTHHFSSYLEEITKGINNIAEGDFHHPIPIRTQNELGLIAGCINEMSEEIQKNIDLERQAEQEKNQLITSVAHDIRTPLTSILGYLELLFHKSSKDNISLENQQEYLRIAYEKSLRLMTLTEDLFTYTKVSFEELKMQLQPLDLIMFLEQMIEEFYPLFIDAELHCQFYHSTDSILLDGDSSMLARAFSNLLSNAVKYGKDGKQLLISAEVLMNAVVIKITNYGMIIPEESLKHIFERFYRVENSRSLDTGGSGLGLSIAQKIISLHNGTIRATSGHDGTSFIVTLPLKKERSKNEKTVRL